MAAILASCPVCGRNDVPTIERYGRRLAGHRQTKSDPRSQYCTGYDLLAVQPEPRSVAHNANARTGVYLGELRDV